MAKLLNCLSQALALTAHSGEFFCEEKKHPSIFPAGNHGCRFISSKETHLIFSIHHSASVNMLIGL